MEDSMPLLQHVADLRRCAAALARSKAESQELDVTQSQTYYDACQGITNLKARNRDVFLSSEAKRQKVAQASSTGDAHSLTLQNLLYEKEHLQREIDKERSYPTAEFDRIVLVPVEQLRHDAPEVHAQAMAEGGGDARKFQHALTLGRLKHERESRLQLEAELSAAKQKLAALRSGTRAKVALIDSLPALAERIKVTAQPLAQALGVEVEGQQARYARSYGLPAPLYTLFSLFDAVRATLAHTPSYGPLQLPALAAAPAAGGSAEAAPAPAAAATTGRAVPLSSVSVDVVDAVSVDLPASLPAALRTAVYSLGPAALRHALHGEGQQEGDSGRPAKRARIEGAGAGSASTAGASSSSSSAGAGGATLQALLAPHAKALLLAVQAGGEGSLACALRFQYLPLLDVITVSSSGSPGAGQGMGGEAVATLLAEGKAGGTPARMVHLTERQLQAIVPGDNGSHVQSWTAALSCVSPVVPPAAGSPSSVSVGDERSTGTNSQASSTAITRAPFPLAAVGHRPYFWAQALAGLHSLPPQELIAQQQGSEAGQATIRLPSAKAVVEALAAACLAL